MLDHRNNVWIGIGFALLALFYVTAITMASGGLTYSAKTQDRMQIKCGEGE